MEKKKKWIEDRVSNYKEMMEFMSKEDFFNVIYDLFDLMENESFKDIEKILRSFSNYKVDKNYIKYIRDIYSVDGE